jgi:hypothetical protein
MKFTRYQKEDERRYLREEREIIRPVSEMDDYERKLRLNTLRHKKYVRDKRREEEAKFRPIVNQIFASLEPSEASRVLMVLKAAAGKK